MKKMKKIKRFLTVTMISLFCMSVPTFAAVDVYTVKGGDTLWFIAKKYQVGVSEIISANDQFKNPNLIFPGDKVNVPRVDAAVLSFEEQVLSLVNKERAKVGVSPLKMNWEAARVARIKSEDMRDNNYFNHQSPTYGSPFEMLKKFKVVHSAAGENIAKGQKTPEAVMTAWMNSEGHRKNILSPNFTELGVGYAAGKGSTYWTQMFIKP